MATRSRKAKNWKGGSSFLKFVLGLIVIVMAANLLYAAFAPEVAEAPENGKDSPAAVNDATPEANANMNNATNDAGDAVNSQAPSTNTAEDADADNEPADTTTDEVTDEDAAADADQASGSFNAAAITDASYTMSETSDTQIYDYGSSNAVSVMPATSESIVRNSLSADEELPFTVNGHAGVQITGRSLKDGSAIVYLLITEGDTLYFVRGSEAFLTDVKTNFTTQ